MANEKIVFSEKQKEIIQIFQEKKLSRITILVGAVRSGKTWVSLVLWGLWVLTMPKSNYYLMCGKTVETLRRNCLDNLEEIFGEENFSYSMSKKQAWLFGRCIYLQGACDGRAESKIRGITLQGAYCDEVTLFPEEFFKMLLSRLSVENAILLATTNPENPSHWLKKKYLDRKNELDLQEICFALDDNPFLPEEYKKQLKKEYTDIFYERYILGKWVAAEGAIYRQFANNAKDYLVEQPDYDFIQVGVDFGGNQSAFAFVACGLKNDFEKLTCLCSEKHPANGIDPDKLYNLLEKFLVQVEQKYGAIDVIYADSAEQTLINGMRSRTDVAVRNSVKNPILDRIRCMVGLVAEKRFFYTKDCESLVKALSEAMYAPDKQKDERLDNGSSDIDTLDAFEYSWEKYIKAYAGGK